MTCQPYNSAAERTAGEVQPSRGAVLRLPVRIVALLLALLSPAPAAGQVGGEPAYGPPVMAPCGPMSCCPAPCLPLYCWPACPLTPCPPPACGFSPTILGPSWGQAETVWPQAIGAGESITAYFPPAELEDAAPLLDRVPGAVRVIVPEAFLNRLLARSDTDTGPVVDNILGADVTGSQNTNTTVTVDVIACAQLARMQLELKGTTVNQTIGVTPQAAVRSRGTHDFRLTKQVDFDGLKFSTRTPAAWVTPRLTNEGAATPLTGVPLLGPLSNQIAITEAERRRPAAEQIITRRVTDQVAPRFNQEVDQQLSDANVHLQRHIPWLLGAAGLTPADVSLASTDEHILFGLRIPQVLRQSSEVLQQTDRPILPAPLGASERPAADEPAAGADTASEEGEFEVIRQISDEADVSGGESSPPGQPRPPSLLLPLDAEPTSVAPFSVTPPGTDPPAVTPPGPGPTDILPPRGIESPPSFTAGASFTVAIHEAAINYALQRAPLGGARVPDRTIDRLLEQLVALLAGTPPGELSLDGLGDERPEFATIVLRQEDPLSVRFADGQVVIEAVAAFEPLLTPAVPAQRVQIPFSLIREEGRLMLVPGAVTVASLPGAAGGPMVELARPIIRQQVTQRLKPVEIPTTLPLNLPGLPVLELTTREARLADGWLLIAVD